MIGGLASQSMVAALVILLVIFGFTFLVVRFLVEKFIHRQIKLIYKFINQTKASKREVFFQKKVLPMQRLVDVGEEVWVGDDDPDGLDADGDGWGCESWP